MRLKKNPFLFFGLILYSYAFISVIEGCESKTESKENLPSQKSEIKQRFVGSQTCQSCHQEAFSDWQKSDHFLSMLPANDTTVLGDFDDVTYSADGVNNRFFMKEGKFFINTEGADGVYRDFEVLYTFGHFPLQQYLVAFDGGRMQATRVSWDSRDKRWYHQYQNQKIPHEDWLHWTGNAQNWNTMCASCHSTNLKKDYNFTKDAFHTTWSEVNVTCESCHGQGNKHVAFINSDEYKNGATIKNYGLHYGADLNPKIQINTCAHCHSRKAEISETKMNTDEIMDDLIPQIISTEFYFADGQIDDEDYVYGSFLQSKMYHNDITCSNCHDPHSGKIYMAGNNLCMSCHEPKYNLESHHFHKVKTKGAECVSCHMPSKTYMGNDHRRDHSFRVPRPDLSVKYGVPNACNSCHKDQVAKWAAEAVDKWYGKERTYHFSDDLVPGSELSDQSEKHLLKLLTDTLQPEIARATAVHYLRNFQTQSSLDALLFALGDDKAMVRYHALKSLVGFPPETWLNNALSGLTDNVRAVRIAAADLYHSLPPSAIPAHAKNAYLAADRENKQYLENQLDFSVGNVMYADYKMKSQDEISAIQLYIRGLEKDSLMNYARLNLSTAYNITGNNEKALQTLMDAAAIDLYNDRIYYNLGLLHNETGNVSASMDNFQKAVDLESQNPRLYYNYGLSLMQSGNITKAETIMTLGLSINPYDEALNYATAYLYIQQKNRKKAATYVQVLNRLNPDHPDYQQMFRDFGM